MQQSRLLQWRSDGRRLKDGAADIECVGVAQSICFYVRWVNSYQWENLVFPSALLPKVAHITCSWQHEKACDTSSSHLIPKPKHHLHIRGLRKMTCFEMSQVSSKGLKWLFSDENLRLWVLQIKWLYSIGRIKRRICSDVLWLEPKARRHQFTNDDVRRKYEHTEKGEG